MNRWSLYIDVEGFSYIYEKRSQTQALQSLGGLMDALFRIGSRSFSRSPERLFIHQFGDGFVVVSDFPEAAPDRPLALSIAVMRHLLHRGIATKIAISGGDFADVFRYYPIDVQSAAEDHRYVPIGDGVMTIIPVMGSALICPYKLAQKRSGAVLLLDPTPFLSIPPKVILTSTTPSVVDWIHSHLPLVDNICDSAGLDKIAPVTAKADLREYIHANPSLPTTWVTSTLDSVGLSGTLL